MAQKQRLADDAMIKRVVARLTKGDAFRIHAHEEYLAKQEKVEAEVRATLVQGRTTFFDKYVHELHDVKF